MVVNQLFRSDNDFLLNSTLYFANTSRVAQRLLTSISLKLENCQEAIAAVLRHIPQGRT
ncbi:MAG TPA: hypothetical protein V6C91_01385 [Coleofasciculaceae cyanobacterium]